MSDAELLQLIAQKSPDQLTLLELNQLKQRLWDSAELRIELLERRQMREYLAEALERIDVSLSSLPAGKSRTPAHHLARRLVLLLAVASLLVAGVVLWRQPWKLRTSDASIAKANKTPDLPTQDTPESAPRGGSEQNKSPEDPTDSPQDSTVENTNEAPQAETSNPSAAAAIASAADSASSEKAIPVLPSPPPVSGPWDSALRADAPHLPFAQVAFRPVQTSKSTPSKEILTSWLKPMNAQSQFSERRVGAGNCGAITGIMRLLSPWSNDAALRFSLEDYDRLKIHFFHGERGVSLAFYQGLNFAWTGYETTRQPGSPQPDRYLLAATDGGRNMRTEIRHGGPYELRYRDGEIILSRGDIALVRAPLPGVPTEVFFDGRATFTGLEIIKTEGAPFEPPNSLNVEDGHKASQLAWKPQLADGAEFKNHEDGSVELIAHNVKQRSLVTAPIPGEGLRQIILKIDAASPGVGVFLGRGEAGAPHEVLKILRDQRTGLLGLSLHGNDDTHERQFESVDERTTALVGESLWLRLLFGCGMLRCWSSLDGVHWAEPFYEPRTNLPGDVRYLGLHAAANRPECRIRLRSIHIQPLNALNGLAEEQLRVKAPAFPLAADMGDWTTQVSSAQPSDVENSAWRRACAINTLAAGCNASLGNALASALLDDALPQLPRVQQLDVLEEAALVLDVRSDQNRLMQYLARFHRVGEQAQQDGEPGPFSLIRRPMMNAPIATPHHVRLGGEKLIYAELIARLDSSQWRETLAFCDILRFYRLDENLPLVTWAKSIAQRQIPEQIGTGDNLVEQRDVWRHPLIEELDKDAYNYLAEFQALLDSEAFEEAARMIAAARPHATFGVAADRRDARLLVSLPAALRLAMRDYPPLQQVIGEQYAELALLRVRRAMGQGDEEAVRSVALQFDATPAAAIAARWLGDRALSRGYFEQALAFYARAGRISDLSLLQELAPRQRLAGAMLGREIGTPVSAEVELGDVQIPPAEFETMIKQMLERAAASPVTAVQGALSSVRVQPTPAPRSYASQPRSRMEGPAGDRPNELPRPVREGNIDWVSRQVASVIEGDTLYMTNRFHLAAYDLNNGQRLWQSPAPPGKGARSHEWSLVPMRPIVTEKQVLARQLTGDGPVLSCFDKQNGQIVWTSTPPPGEWLASDPIAIQGRLLLFRIRRDLGSESTLVLCDYDIATGEPTSQQELLRLREPSWATRRVCQTAAVEDALVAVLGGCVVCADLTGGVRWVRRQLYTPPDEAPAWGGQHQEPPLVDGRRLFLTQPGVHALECVDVDTGRSIWTKTMPDIRRLIGLEQGRLLVETSGGFVALQSDNGEPLWRHETTDRLEGRLCGAPGGLMYVRPSVGERDDVQPRPELVWLDLATGRERHRAVLNDLKRQDLRFGLAAAHKDRLWALVGAGPNDPHRDFVELTPQAEPQGASPLVNDVWLKNLADPLHRAAARVLPDWQVFRGIVEKHSGRHDEMHGEREILSLDGSRSQPVVFARRMTIPQGSQPRLRMRLAMEQHRNSKLSVEFQGKPLWEQSLDEPSLGSRQWRDFETDLASQAGQTGWLVVRLTADKEERLTTYWKRLELAF